MVAVRRAPLGRAGISYASRSTDLLAAATLAMAIYQLSEMGLLLAEKALDSERAIAAARALVMGLLCDAFASRLAPTLDLL